MYIGRMISPRSRFWVSCLYPAKKKQQVPRAHLLAGVGVRCLIVEQCVGGGGGGFSTLKENGFFGVLREIWSPES